jgi:hypothetical protein
MNQLKEKAKKAFEPRYTRQQLCSDLIKLAKEWRESDDLDTLLDEIGKQFELVARKDSNRFGVLVKAVCPDGLNRQTISKLARQIENRMSRPPAPRKMRWGSKKKRRAV